MKKTGYILTILTLVFALLVSTGAAQTGVGFVKQFFAEKVVIHDDSSGSALTIQQDGSGAALAILDSTGFPVGGFDTNGDLISVVEKTGGNEGAVHEVWGIPAIALVTTGAGTDANDANETIDYMDATPAGEWTAVDADTVCATAAAYSKDADGTSLAIAFLATADVDDGCVAVVDSLDWSGAESASLYVWSDDTTLALGDLHFLVDDSAAAPDDRIDIPANAEANYWYYDDLTTGITACADCDHVDNIGIVLSAAGAAKALAEGGFTIYIDAVYKWEVTEEDALNVAILRDGLVNLVDSVTNAQLVEFTDYFVHYEAGNDFVVWISDMDSITGYGIAALQP